MTKFEDLGLAAPLLKALEEEGYTTPTPIQAQAIPPLLEGRDLLGIAQTGTGKTAAFALPILHRLAANPMPAPRKGCRVLVLSPTRELAAQIAQSFEDYGRHLGLRVAVIFGGVGYRPQRDALMRGLDVLVATPGRLIDLMGEGTAVLKSTEVLVLDEADQMLDLGFIKPIRQIVATLPSQRHNLLFSATMPREVTGLAESLLRSPVRIAVTPVASTVERVAQRIILVEAKRKRALLAELMADPTLTRALVFTRTKRGADRVAEHLEGHGVKVAAIHGNKSQRQREIALEAFRDGKIRVLVATDIAARGIDVDEVSHVVNYELPEVPEVYVHRIGRTARAGASGIAISLCDHEERDLLRAIEKVTRQSIAAEDRRGDMGLTVDTTKSAPRRGSDRNGRGDRPGRSEHHGRGEHRGRSEHGGRGEQGRGPERAGRPERNGRPGRTEGRTEGGAEGGAEPRHPAAGAPSGYRPERGERSERPHSGRHGERSGDRRSEPSGRERRSEQPRAIGEVAFLASAHPQQARPAQHRNPGERHRGRRQAP